MKNSPNKDDLDYNQKKSIFRSNTLKIHIFCLLELKDKNLSETKDGKMAYTIGNCWISRDLLVVVIIVVISEKPSSGGTLQCPKGYCKSNLYDGIKTCPANSNGYVEYTPGLEVCNPVNACRSKSELPCTYWDPGIGTSCPNDSGYTGICPDGVDCPDFAQVYFELLTVPNSGVDPEFGTTSYRTFVQNTVWRSPDNIPLSLGRYDSTGNLTCGLSSDNLKIVWPYRSCIRGRFTYNVEDGLWYCMELSIECGPNDYPVRNSDGSYVCRTIIPDPFD